MTCIVHYHDYLLTTWHTFLRCEWRITLSTLPWGENKFLIPSSSMSIGLCFTNNCGERAQQHVYTVQYHCNGFFHWMLDIGGRIRRAGHKTSHQTAPSAWSLKKLNIETLYYIENLDPLQGSLYTLTPSSMHGVIIWNHFNKEPIMRRSVQVRTRGICNHIHVTCRSVCNQDQNGIKWSTFF